MTVTVFGFDFVDVSFLLFVILFLVCNCWWFVIACCIAYFIVCVTVNVGNALIIPDNRRLKRASAWTTGRRTIVGKLRNTWDSQKNMCCRWKCLGDWSTMLTGVWLTELVSQACTPYDAKPCIRGMLNRIPKTF